jgi:para-nitrobenzyl esterase
MANHTKSDAINRRSLLTRGAALAGGAAALAVTASAEEKPKVPAPGVAKPATPAVPNLHPPVVEVRGGKLRGFRDGRISTFLGIPYAEAERFEQPGPVKPWEGIRSAQTWGPVCPIPPMTAVSVDDFVFPHRYWVENEHCQFLNVWTQSASATTKKPVMVWIHGGGFTTGSSMESYAYDGRSLCEFGDVVVVSVNHRLNVLGTLDLSAYGAEYANSRNTGMADLVAALQWVHENIDVFGGDPGNVTIFGQSGGGGKVTRMMFIPAAKGLFHKVICESGSLVNYRDIDMARTIENQQAVAAEILKTLNLNGSQIDKLKQIPYRDLLAAGNAAIQTVSKATGAQGVGWNPVADDKFVMRELCDWSESIPYISGTVMTEHNTNLEHGEFTKNEWSRQEVDERLGKAFGDKKEQIVAEFRKLHPRKKIQDALYLDTSFRPSSKLHLARKLEKAKAPVYHYMFTYEFPVNGGVTAFHCGEIAFAFHALAEPHMRVATGGAPEAVALQNKISQAWVNFARTGNPSQPGLEWRPYTLAGREMMELDTVTAVRSFNDDVLLPLLPRQRRG